jgi:hypothetical protein
MQAAAEANDENGDSSEGPALFGVDDYQLDTALREASECRSLFDSVQWREIQSVNNDMRERQVRARLSEALGNPSDAVTGNVGQLRMGAVRTARLTNAIRFAQDVG